MKILGIELPGKNNRELTSAERIARLNDQTSHDELFGNEGFGNVPPTDTKTKKEIQVPLIGKVVIK